MGRTGPAPEPDRSGRQGVLGLVCGPRRRKNLLSRKQRIGAAVYQQAWCPQHERVTPNPARGRRLSSPGGGVFRDLNGNGTMEPYENPALPTNPRVGDLLARMNLEERRPGS